MQRWIMTCAVLAALLTGCKGKKAEPTPTAQPAASKDAGTAAAAGKPTPAKQRAGSTPELTAETVRAEGKVFLDRWVAAQNQHDFDAYLAMYEPKHFRGIKRTHKSGAKEFDFAGWKKDRKRMVLGKAEVAAELLDISTWLDADSKLKTGVSHVRFTQRWRGGGYADHGIKVLILWRDAKGVQRIVYEDLLNSEPGWDRAPEPGIAALDLEPPKNEAEALALWKQLAPRGDNYEDRLAAIPEDEAIRRPMAVALLRQGNFACESVVEYEGCGQESVEFAPLEPTADLDQPCLRRRLALWALDAIADEDASTLTDELVSLVELPDPETELREAAFLAVVDDEQRLKLLAAAMDEGNEELAEEQAKVLTSIPALIQAVRDLHLDAAVDKLDAEQHRDVLLAAAADDELDIATRSGIVTQYEDDLAPAVTQALIALVDDADCSLSMQAAELLAKRGDRSHLPERPTTNDLNQHMNALCMLAHSTDRDYQEAQWKTWFGPELVIDEDEHYDEFAEIEDREDGEDSEDDEGEDDSTQTVQADGTVIEQDGKTTTTRTKIDAEAAASIGYLDTHLQHRGWSCSDDECEIDLESDGDKFFVGFAPAPDGSLHIVRFRTYRWSGCGC